MERKIRGEVKNKRTKLVDVVPLSQPYVIMVDPCDACNFKCNFCPTNISKENLSLRHKHMPYDMFVKIVDDMKEFPEKIKAVDLYGFGEPLLHKDLPRMIKYLKESNVCEKIRIATNGALLNKKLSESLVDSGLDYMKISIEALNAADYKEICGANIIWEEYVENIRYLFEISRGKMEIGAKIVSAAFKKEHDEEYFLNTFSPISDYTFVENLKNVWAGFDEIQLSGEDTGEDYYTQHVTGYSICSYPITHMVIHSNGDICSCCFDWKHEISYANVNELSLKEAWNSEKLLQFRLSHLNKKQEFIPFCNKCEAKGYDNIDNDAQTMIRKYLGK